MAFSMFCSIPAPVKAWDDKLGALLLSMFPVIGAIIGVVWYGLAQVVAWGWIPMALGVALVVSTPFLLTGFLHLDGYMDTCDAILSRRDLAERQRILKDSHTGAFAVIALVILCMIAFGAVMSILEGRKEIGILVVIPILSRALAALGIFCLQPMNGSGYITWYQQQASNKHKGWLSAVIVLAYAYSGIVYGLESWWVLGVASMVYAVAVGYGYKQLEGISGDVSGYAQTLCEVGALVALAVY